MTPARWIGVLLVAFTVMFVAAQATTPVVPDWREGAQGVLEAHGKDDTAARASLTVGATVVPLLLAISVALYALLGAPVAGTVAHFWPTLGLAGGIGATTAAMGALVSRWASTGIAGEGTATDGLVTLAALSTGLFIFVNVFLGLFLLGFGAILLRGSILPRWLGWFAVVVAVFGLVGALSSFMYGHVEDNPLGLLNFVGMVGWMLFVLISGILLLARGGDPRSATTSA